MTIKKASFQAKSTLREFFKEVGHDELDSGDGMIALFDELERRLSQVEIWAFTSVNWVCLIPTDEPDTAKVRIAGAGDDYYVEYLIPADDAPWPGAVVRGEAVGVQVAAAMVEKAIALSGAWHR